MTVPATVAVMGVPIASLAQDEAVAAVRTGIGSGEGGWVCPINLDVLRQVVGSAELRRLVAGAEIRLADGMPLVWASRLQRTPLPERVAGSSLVQALCAELARAGGSVFLVGGHSEETLDAAASRLVAENPGLRLAGTWWPPFGFESRAGERRRIADRLGAAEPDLVFVGLGFPKQERLIAELRRRLPRAWFLSCGAGIDLLAGEVRRASPRMQRLGLEWTVRLAQEPQRLARRYLVEGLPFAARLVAGSAGRGLVNRPAAAVQERVFETR